IARPVRWSVHRLPGESCFGDEARTVKVQGCKKPLFLARGLAMPAARPIPLATRANPPDGGADAPWPVSALESVQILSPDYETGRSTLDGRFAGQSWQVEIAGKGEGADVFVIANGKRQWLFKLGGESTDVLWAGDLDGDGRLDLFIRDGEEGP